METGKRWRPEMALPVSSAWRETNRRCGNERHGRPGAHALSKMPLCLYAGKPAIFAALSNSS